MKARILKTLAAAGAIALLAAACGNDDDGGAAPAPDEPAQEVPETEVDEETAPTDDKAVDIEIDEAALQAILDDWRTEVDSFGATLSIRVAGHDDIHLASGVNDRDATITVRNSDGSPNETVEHSETPMPTDGTYQIVDVTRTFVTAIALQLVDEGRLSLDDPVERWLPELPNGDKITVGMLLDNTSGMGSWYGPTSPDGDADYIATLQADFTRSFTPEEVLAKHMERPPLGQPGEHFVWSDADFQALGLLIERELGQDIATVIEEKLADPLALDDTFFSDGTTRGTRHIWFSLDDEEPFDILDLQSGIAIATGHWVGHGAMISSSQDLLAWGEALYSGDVLGEETTETMLEMRSSFSPPSFIGQPEDGPVHYGLGAMGFCIDQTGCNADEAQEIVGHSGAWANANLLAHHRDSGTTVMVHTNTFPTPGVPQRFSLVADVLQELGLTDEVAK